MDLHAPLGGKVPQPRRPLGAIVLAALGAVALTGFGLYLFEADPHGGEPYAVATIPPPPPPKPTAAAPQPAPDPTPTGSIATPAARTSETTTIENGVRVVSPGAPASAPRAAGPMIIDVSKALDEAPRKSAQDRQAQDRHANTSGLPTVTTGAPPAASARPRIAIVVGGLGLSEIATRTAIETTPAAVDLAFVPVGAALASSVQMAQSKGHEIILQLPMQSPQGTSPAPHALSASEPPAALVADLDWLTSRIGRYAGVTNLLGASVTADPTAMTTILKAVGRRGVFYVDDGTSRRSVAASLAASLDVPAVKADVVLDATTDPAAVRANLERLAAIARSKGTAVGTATALSDHIAAITRFANELAGRGIDLVPVGAIARRGPSVATTR